MENVAPSRALNRRSTHLLQIGFVVLAVGTFLTIVGLFMVTVPLFPPNHSLYGLYNLAGDLVFIVGLVVALVGVAMAIRAVTRRKENDLALVTGQFLGQSLDGRYTFIRNINRPGLGYIDAVLVGPPGVLVFRILDNIGSFANEASNWLKQNQTGEWIPLGFSPTKEAVDDIQSVRQYLAKRNMGDVPVFGEVVFIRDPSRVQIVEKEPVVPISLLASHYTNLQRDYLSKQDRIPQEIVSVIRRLLLE
jgi:hypothetical protein